MPPTIFNALNFFPYQGGFQTLAVLQAEYPVGFPGAFAYIIAEDTYYKWNVSNSSWEIFTGSGSSSGGGVINPTISTMPFRFDGYRQYGTPASPLTTFPNVVQDLTNAVNGGKVTAYFNLASDPSTNYPENWAKVTDEFVPGRIMKFDLTYVAGTPSVVEYVIEIVAFAKPTISNIQVTGANTEGATKTVSYTFASTLPNISENVAGRLIRFYFADTEAELTQSDFPFNLNEVQGSNNAGFALGSAQVGKFGRVAILVQNSEGTNSIVYSSPTFGPIAATGAFTPANEPKVLRWYDGTDFSVMVPGSGITLEIDGVSTSGQLIDTIHDKITNSDGSGPTTWSLQQVSGPNQFVFANNYMFSRDVNSRFETTSTWPSTPVDIDLNESREIWVIFWHDGTDSTVQLQFMNNEGNIFYVDEINAHVGHASNRETPSNTAPAGQWNYVRFASDGSLNELLIDVNGTNHFTGSNSGSSNNLAIGGTNNFRIGFPGMRWKHIVFVEGRLTGAELTQFETWASAQ
ncbi:MAG: hypothetical protein AAFW00_19815 [Bacteroidota bacterium]